MSKSCCTHIPENQAHELRYRRVLWAVLCINLALFLIEIIAGLTSRSAALRADALDFLGDAANYAVSLYAIRLNLRYRAGAALVKGVTMGLFGVAVLITALQYALFRTVPEPMTMGAVGILALLANGISFILLWAYQRGDSNMRSVWLCSRNDVIGNFAVLLAALGVFGTGTNWPDIIVAVIMAAFALQGAWVVTRLAWKELAGPRSPGSAGVEVCDRGQLNFRQGQLEFPGVREDAIEVEDDFYGERSAGETAVATGAEAVGGSSGGKVRYGLENGAEIPAGSKTAERDAAKAYVANAARSVCGYVGRDSAVADGRAGAAA